MNHFFSIVLSCEKAKNDCVRFSSQISQHRDILSDIRGRMNNIIVKELSVGTLNVRGCKKERQIQEVAEDALRYKLQILGITETHTGKDDEEEKIIIKYKEVKQEFTFYQVGTNTHHGVGILIRKEMCPRF